MPACRRHVLICLGALALPWAVRAQVMYEGQSFERSMRVAGADLRLNGVGIRQVAWFKGYLAALYLSGSADTAAKAVAMPGPKRIQLRILHEVPAVEFSKAVRKGVNRNIPAAQQAGMAERVERLVKIIDSLGKVNNKDVVNLDFDPARGLVLTVNATARGEPIAGEDFYAALLRSFVGDVPYDEKLRAGLLGKPAP
jgi:Chalcone isomerase-like